MSRCPRCFTALNTSKLAWVCAESGCRTNEVDQVASKLAGHEVPLAPLYADTYSSEKKGSWPPKPNCPSCSLRMSDACPTCHLPLPENWITTNVTAIAMAGARASGKSLHVAVGLQVLERFLLQHANTQMQASPETERVFRRVYLEPLNESRTVLASTPLHEREGAYQREPLVFDLGQIKGKRQLLVVRDVAGEEIQQLRDNRSHLSFIGRADAVFFIFDPLAIEEVRLNLKDVIPLSDDVGADPVRVMTNLMTIVKEAADGVVPPIAVILSKFDAIEELRKRELTSPWGGVMNNPGAAYARDNSETSLEFDAVDGALLDAEVRSLILKLGARGLVTLLENPANGRPIDHQYFAISALGHSPRGATLNPSGIAPFRVLDPFKWVLSKNRVL